MTPPEWSAETEDLLRKSGWFEGRDVSLDVEAWHRILGVNDGFVLTESAARALREFGGLRVDAAGAGVDRARASFELTPTLAWGESDRFATSEAILGESLYPLGEMEHGHAFLAITRSGRVFAIGERTYSIGSSIHRALESLVRGKRDPE